MKSIIGPHIDPRFESEVPVYFLNGLGLVATGKRRLKDITPFLGYFPVPMGDDEPYNKGEYVRTGKVLALIHDRVNKYYTDTQKFAKDYISKGLSPNSTRYVKEVCKRTYQWLIEYVQYKQDRAGREELRRPARVVKEARTGVDCDCFTYFISTVLKNLNIPHKLRIIAVGEATSYHHIYVVVPMGSGSLEPYRNKHRYTVVDPVLDTFDQEPEHITAYHDYPINVSQNSALNGIPNLMLDELYINLKTTRQLMAQNPASYQKAGINPQAAIPLLDQALQAWYTPQRDLVLSRLAKLDHTIYTGMNGVPMNGNFFKNVSNAVKQVANNVKTVVQTAVTDPKKLINDTVDNAKKIIDQVVDYGRTGVLFIPRKAFMGLVELNVRGLATDLKKGLSDPTISARLKRVWEGDLGGDINNLIKVINSGANRPFLFGLQGLAGEPVTVASLTTSASSILATIKPILDAIKGIVSAVKTGSDIFSDTKGIINTFSNKGGANTAAAVASNTSSPIYIPSNSNTGAFVDTTPVQYAAEYPAPSGVNPNWSNPNYENTNTPAPKSNNTAMWVGGTVLAGLLAYAAISSNKKKKGLNGLEGTKPKPKRTKARTKGKTANITF